MYLIKKNDSTSIQYAYYFIPILSDANSAEFIKFEKIVDKQYSIDGPVDMVTEICRHLAQEVKNELERIRIVEERDKLRTSGNKNAPSIIENFDITRTENGTVGSIGGAEFKFFPMLY